MKQILIFTAFCLLLSGCAHWKWVMKHQDEVCAKCPQTTDNSTATTDTTVYAIMPPDTMLIEGLDWNNSTGVLIDNTQYKVIKEKGKVVVIYKDRKVPVTVRKYLSSQQGLHTITVKQPYIPKWYWILLYGSNIFWLLVIICIIIKRIINKFK